MPQPHSSSYTSQILQLPIHFADEVRESDVDQQAASVRPTKRLTKASTIVLEHPPLPLPESGMVQVVLNLTLPPSCHLTEGAPSTWQIYPGVCEGGGGEGVPIY